MTGRRSFNRQLVAHRLQAELNDYLGKHALPVSGLAERLSIPASTVYSWLEGSRIPNRVRLQAICRTLGLDYALLRDRSQLLDGLYGRAFTSFEGLNHRARRATPEEMPSLAALAATVLHKRILEAGVSASLRITRTYCCQIYLLGPQLEGLSLRIVAEPGKGIRASVLDYLGEPLEGCVWALTDHRVPLLIEKLTTYNWTSAAATEEEARATEVPLRTVRQKRWRPCASA